MEKFYIKQSHSEYSHYPLEERFEHVGDSLAFFWGTIFRGGGEGGGRVGGGGVGAGDGARGDCAWGTDRYITRPE